MIDDHTAEANQQPLVPPMPVAAKDGKPGCPEIVWDGPYQFRCSMGIDRCGQHGRFEVRAESSTVKEA